MLMKSGINPFDSQEVRGRFVAMVVGGVRAEVRGKRDEPKPLPHQMECGHFMFSTVGSPHSMGLNTHVVLVSSFSCKN